jgi:hypothetical protein
MVLASTTTATAAVAVVTAAVVGVGRSLSKSRMRWRCHSSPEASTLCGGQTYHVFVIFIYFDI